MNDAFDLPIELDTGPDPDRLHDAIANGDRPDPMLRAPVVTPPERIAVLRARALHRWGRLAALTPDDPPPTMPEVEDDQLEAFCEEIARKIFKAEAQARGPFTHWRNRLPR